jgi:hypothetical protein
MFVGQMVVGVCVLHLDKKRTLTLDLRSKPACRCWHLLYACVSVCQQTSADIRCWHLLAGAGQALLQVLRMSAYVYACVSVCQHTSTQALLQVLQSYYLAAIYVAAYYLYV